jgi:hypothetical protein
MWKTVIFLGCGTSTICDFYNLNDFDNAIQTEHILCMLGNSLPLVTQFESQFIQTKRIA